MKDREPKRKHELDTGDLAQLVGATKLDVTEEQLFGHEKDQSDQWVKIRECKKHKKK